MIILAYNVIKQENRKKCREIFQKQLCKTPGQRKQSNFYKHSDILFTRNILKIPFKPIFRSFRICRDLFVRSIFHWKDIAVYFFFCLSIWIFKLILIAAIKFFTACLVSEYWGKNDTSCLSSCFMIRFILMTSKQSRLCRTSCQLVKVQWNYLEHFTIYVGSIYI